MTNMELLEQAFALVSQYTNSSSRSGLTDLWLYDTLVGMYENDYMDEQDIEYIWTKTPDEVMEIISNSSDIPSDLEYGWDAYDEGVREYLHEKEFIKHVDDVTDEELQANLQQRIN